MTPQQRSIKYVSASVIWVAIMLVILFSPVSKIDPPGYVTIPGLDKLVHLLLFAILTFLIVKALRELKIKFRFWTLLIVLLLFGLTTELIQLMLPDRSGDFFDFLADAAGVVVVLFYISRP